MLNIECFIIFETVEVVQKNIPGEAHDYLHFAFLLVQKME